MKPLFRAAVFCVLAVALTVSSFAQNKESKDEQFNKIAKLTQSKKSEDQEKAYQMSKDFVAQFGKDNDDKVKKIKQFAANHRMGALVKAIDEVRMADAMKYGKEILAEEPENSSVTLNLAYGAFQANTQKNDKSFDADGINYAKQTLSLFEAGKLPKNFEPLKDQAEATALMYYAVGMFSLDKDMKEAARNFYKSTQFEAQFKNKAYPYYMVAAYYEKLYEAGAKDYQAKHGAKTAEDAAMKADQEKLNAVIERMLDAYARVVKAAEAENHANKNQWRARFTEIYKFRKGGDAGLNEYVASISNTPMPDPAAL
jgi:hypothetical protein